MKIKQFIEDNFLIDHHETSELTPFKFRPIQNSYYDLLNIDYEEVNNFTGLREILLKARKEGMTSFVISIFVAVMILSTNPVRFLEISYKDEATLQHYRRAKIFVLSFYARKIVGDDINLRIKLINDPRFERMVFKSINEGHEFVLADNGASFYVGTASTKTGERGGTVQGILFSEAAHYPDTGIISASEIIEGTKSMVAVGTGMIFIESTANGMNHYKKIWDQAELKTVDYKPRFFSWRDFYTQEQFEKISAGFSDKRKIPQEFPDNPHQAFISSGQSFFDVLALNDIMQFDVMEPMVEGSQGLVY